MCSMANTNQIIHDPDKGWEIEGAEYRRVGFEGEQIPASLEPNSEPIEDNEEDAVDTENSSLSDEDDEDDEDDE